MTVPTLTWNQVHAWRLAQHHLAPRVPNAASSAVVTRTVGLQAQVLSAAELALWARIDGLAREDVQAALWQDRTLVKTWAMRGTLHLIAAHDLPLIVAARRLDDTVDWPNYFAYHGITPTEYTAFREAVPAILSHEPITREQFAAALGQHTGSAALRDLVMNKSWGMPLKPLAWSGDLCFGPNQGQNVTFVRPSAWLGEWQSMEPESALFTVIRRFLAVYGPATPPDFAKWWWIAGRVTVAKQLFQALGDELITVEVEGWRAFALRSTLESMRAMATTGTVNLLPLFDAYVLGLGRGDVEPILPRAHKAKVFRPQGWVSAVVLVDGSIHGVWEHKARRGSTLVNVNMFAPLTPAIQQKIEAEAERLGEFLNAKVAVAFAQ